MSAMNSELALFQPIPKERAVKSIKWINFRPTTQISSSGAIEFSVPGTTPYYVLLGKTMLHVKAKIMKLDGSNISEASDNVSLTNLSMHSLFRQCDISLNQQIINPNVGTSYPYKSYIDVLLRYNHSVKEGQLQAEGYVKDTAYGFDSRDNTAHWIRREWTKNSIIADFEGVIHDDLAQQSKAILNGVHIGVKLYQSTDDFRIFSRPVAAGSEEEGPTNYKVEIVDAVLRVCYLDLQPSVIIAHNNMLLKAPAVYPYWKSVVKSFAIPKGSYNFSVEDLFHGNCPCRLVVGFVSSEAFSGSMQKNPYNFSHYSLNFLEFSLNNVSVPGTALQPKFENDPDETNPVKCYKNGYKREYLTLFRNQYPQQDGLFISADDYPGGYCLYSFDIKPGTSKHLFCDLLSGHTRLSGRFDVPLPEPVVVVCYASFPAEFKIDESRLVIP